MQKSAMAIVGYVVSRRTIFFLFVAGSFGFLLPAKAQFQGSKKVTEAHELSLGGFARPNRNCEGGNLPEISLDRAPEHGFVCLRRGEVRMKKMFGPNQDRCVNRMTSGIHVIYRSDVGYAGSDKVRYTVRFPKAQPSFDVDLTVVPDGASPNAVGRSSATRSVKDGQSLGPIPECSALVSSLIARSSGRL